jgi:hypothetical protein
VCSMRRGASASSTATEGPEVVRITGSYCRMRWSRLLLVVVALGTCSECVVLQKLGTVRPRSSSEIGSSPWSVGAETMDRNYTVWDNWRQYLGPLGAKRARLEGGTLHDALASATTSAHCAWLFLLGGIAASG